MSTLPSGHLLVKVVLNGVDGEFILDTGAGATVVEVKRKGKFNLKSDGTDNTNAGAVGVGGRASLEVSVKNSFKIESFKKRELPLFMMYLDHVNKALSNLGIREVDGMIGADILAGNRSILDYSKRILYLQKSK